MKLKDEHIAAARALRSLSPQERVAAIYAQEILDQHSEEKQKATPAFRLSPEEWQSLKSHLLDGGGVSDAHHVMRILLTALFDDDQDTFWPELWHHLKAAGKHLGFIVPREDGAVTFNGVGPTIPMPADQPIHKPKEQ